MTKKEVSRRIFDEIYTEGRLDRIEPTHDEHCKLREPSRETVLEGPEAIRQYVQSLRGGFPDLRMNVERMIEEDDVVATQLICQGRHNGSFMGVEPTGNEVTVRATVVHRFRGDKVVEADVTYDVLGLLIQIGLKPAREMREQLAARAAKAKV
jgi:predicted ester cyclase